MNPSAIAISDPEHRTISSRYIRWTGATTNEWMLVLVEEAPPPTVADTLNALRFGAIAEAADMAEALARKVAGAADRGERLRVNAYAGLLSRAVRNILAAASELS
jgi:hypothetical protein